MNMKWLKERSALAMMGAVLAIIICTLCVIFAGTIPAIVITTLSTFTAVMLQEVRVYLSNKQYEFDWLNVAAFMLCSLLGVLLVVFFYMVS